MAINFGIISIDRWSISTRLSLWYSLTIMILLGVFSGITYVRFHSSIHTDYDQHLQHEVSLLLPRISLDSADPAFGDSETLASTAYITTDVLGTFVRLISVDGRILAESPNFSSFPDLSLRIPEAGTTVKVSTEWTGKPLRSLYEPLTGRDGKLTGWLEVSGFEWNLHDQLSRLTETFIIGILLSTLMAFVGGYILAQRALRPVDQITEAANQIRTFDLGARLPTQFGVSDELTRLAETINDLLSRLEESIKRERRFISNATHEMITPLTTLRGELDLARGTTASDEMRGVLDVALDDIDRMEGIIRSLLRLSRAERLRSGPHERVLVDEVCAEHVNRFMDRADVHGLALSVVSETGLAISADSVHVGTVVDNLIDNALKYTPDGGKIVLTASRDERHVVIEVTDTGYGFSSETGEHLFDRFYRATDALIQKKSGSGLGLAIARAIVEAYDGELSGTSSGLGLGASFVAQFPKLD